MLLPMAAMSQTFDFDMTKPQPVYSEKQGYGYDLLWMGDAKDGSRDYVWLHLRLAEHLFDNRLDMRVVEKPDWLILE